VEALSDAKKLLFDDIDMMSLSTKRPHVPLLRRDGNERLERVVNDIVTLLAQTVLRGSWIQLHQTWLRHRAIIPTEEVCFRVRIDSLLHFQTRAAQS